MTSRPEYYEAAQTPDLERRLADVVMIGTVTEQDYSNPKAPRVRVQAGDRTTGWIPWSSGSAGGNSDWEPLDKNEQVVLVSPSGDLSQAVIVGTVHQDASEAPDKNPDVTARKWKDGAQQSYNRSEHDWRLDIPDGGSIVLKIGGTTLKLTKDETELTTPKVTVNASGGMQFNTPMLTVSGDVVAGGGVSLITHLHTGVQIGPMLSGPPLGGGAAGGGMGSGGGGGGGWGDTSGQNGWSAPSDPGTTDGDDESAPKAARDVPADATGVYRGAIFTRMEYGTGTAWTTEETNHLKAIGWYPIIGEKPVRVPEIAGPFPFNAAAIPEATFKDHVRTSAMKITEGRYFDYETPPGAPGAAYSWTGEVIVSRYDSEAGKFVDDVFIRRWGGNLLTKKDLMVYGLWTTPLPAGVMNPATTAVDIEQPRQPTGVEATSANGAGHHTYKLPLNVFKSPAGRFYVEYGRYYYDQGDGFNSFLNDFPIYWEVTEAELLENGEVLT